MRRIQAFILGIALLLSSLYIPQEVWGEEEQSETAQSEEETQTAAENQAAVEISAPSAVLMEASTGTVIYEKDADTARPPASVTKVMTMLLIFDALEAGSIKLEDEVTTSEYAASMGGSQVFLEPGETQTVDTMLKCIAVASANDACVAMAEYICGSEEEFVRRMNERADGLGMANTTFVNCNGLDAEGHVTSARDIAIMSRELITKYPQIHDYSMIWMENITHNTSKGTSEFGLTNTNKLVRQYEYATGLKTGSTGEAKFCVSATGEKNGIELIAVVMAAENSKERFSDAVKLLNYGFGKCQFYTDDSAPDVQSMDVEGGVEDTVSVERAGDFSYLDMTGANMAAVEKKTEMEKKISAPIRKGDVLGHIVYLLDGNEIGRTELIAGENVEKAGFVDFFKRALEEVFL
ncbi:MAG TPA: D-alanyl-D-alanine carboxypeptidase [Candidatus Mediterraneibacter stercorigallinarum]|uniref:serine-type D-Ala-D-Ala carboxypeptidase n=1 Tax=Candidatus Mediterraneibacter stercorigallinarum TaxID=2838686 RepID=A0A9D2IIJ9_9FIRM|nr:D-alanyl-D-alanine carboxypeptidase [Candidatus Mediterraneibacter stercorigallinarum]